MLWSESGLLEKLAAHAMLPDPIDSTASHPYQIYGDAAYGLGLHILSSFSGIGEQTSEQLLWNSVMGKGHVSVENSFAIVTNLWPFLHASWKMRVYQSPVGCFY